MDLVPVGNGGAVIAVAAVTFLVLLAAFTALMISIACRYHARKPAYAAKARNPCGLAAGPAAPRAQAQATPDGGH